MFVMAVPIRESSQELRILVRGTQAPSMGVKCIGGHNKGFLMTFIRQLHALGFIAITAILLLSAGCVVGPNFKKPAPPTVPNYTPTVPATTSNTPNVPGGEAQSFADGRDIPGDW